jgi:transposase
VLNKELGLSHERTARVLALGYGLKWSRSGVCRALERLGNRAAPTYQRLQSCLRQSPVVWLDDTGWRVAARPQNLRVLWSEQVTVYVIEPHRGYAEAAALLGEDYGGFLVHDGARCFYGFEQAFHQSCLEHLIRRCREMIQIASPAAALFPLAIKTLLQRGLGLRDRYQQGSVSAHGLAVAAGRLEARLDRLLDRHFRCPANQRLAKHLRHEQPHLFTFLHCPGLPATNNFAERAIRLMALVRKTWGGNRTAQGARTHQILASVLRTCWQQGKHAFAELVKLLRSVRPILLEIIPPLTWLTVPAATTASTEARSNPMTKLSASSEPLIAPPPERPGTSKLMTPSRVDTKFPTTYGRRPEGVWNLRSPPYSWLRVHCVGR